MCKELDALRGLGGRSELIRCSEVAALALKLLLSPHHLCRLPYSFAKQ